MLRSATGICLAAVLPISATADIRFTPREVPKHVYSGGWEHFVGGGVAAFDCNEDGLLDAFIAGGASPSTLWVNTANNAGAALSFEAREQPILNVTGVTGAYPIDLTGDQITDLVILRAGPDLLLKGEGNCSFSEYGSELNFNSGDHWTTAFSATWETGNTLPTLAFGTYVDRGNPDGPFQACDDLLLYRPKDAQYDAPTKLSPGFCSLSMLFTDWKRAGRQDLRVSNDRHYYVKGGQEQMWAMETTPRLYGKADGWRPYQLWGMGIASRDVNGDGYSDVYLTSMGDQKFQLFDPATDGPSYQNVPFEAGAAAHRPYEGGDGRPSTGWHAAFGDIQNDGLDDIFVAKGNVDQMPDAALDDPNNLLIQNTVGQFVEQGGEAGIGSMLRSRGAALADFNLDGKLDLLVVNRRADVQVYENVSKAQNWAALDLQVTGSNRDGIGYFLEVETNSGRWVREVTIGGGHASGVLGPHHFGLGAAESAKVRLVRPDQTVSDWQQLDVNSISRVIDDGRKLRVD